MVQQLFESSIETLVWYTLHCRGNRRR